MAIIQLTRVASIKIIIQVVSTSNMLHLSLLAKQLLIRDKSRSTTQATFQTKIDIQTIMLIPNHSILNKCPKEALSSSLDQALLNIIARVRKSLILASCQAQA